MILNAVWLKLPINPEVTKAYIYALKVGIFMYLTLILTFPYYFLIHPISIILHTGIINTIPILLQFATAVQYHYFAFLPNLASIKSCPDIGS